MANPSTYRPENIPTSPGVYRFFNDHNRVIYVGKAKNLRARLTTYFQSNVDDKVRTMVWEASRVDWTIVGNEIESLQLEFNWIQQERPKYNVIFRDDKSFPYLAITAKRKSRESSLLEVFEKTALNISDLIHTPGRFAN